jgi:hypothetical protein
VKRADAVIQFKEWLPDLPDLNNPGLITADNIQYVNGQWKPFKGLNGSGGTEITLSATAGPTGGIFAQNSGSLSYVYVGIPTDGGFGDLYMATVGTTTGFVLKSQATYNSGSDWHFEQFDDFVLATNKQDAVQLHTIGSATNFVNLATTGTANNADAIGKVGRFILIGGKDDQYHLQWCAIGDIRNWPTPGSSTAQSLQAGEQFLNSQWGRVTGIKGGDQWGIVFQEFGLTRMNYVGGTTVWQFDEIEDSYGCYWNHSIVPANNRWYYLSLEGVCVTDGITSRNISKGSRS